MPWLVALAIMLLFTGLWYQFENKAQQRMQFEQYSAMLQLNVAPLLQNKDKALANAQLNHLRFLSAVPLTAIAVYNKEHQLLLATDLPQALTQYTPSAAVERFSLEHIKGGVVVIRPFTHHGGWPASDFDSRLQQSYLLLLFEPVTEISSWLLPLIVVGLLGAVVLVLIQNNLNQLWQRQQTDIGLIAHKLSQLCKGQQNVKLSEELVPELQALKPAINELFAYHQQTVQQARQELQQLQLQRSQLQQEYDASTKGYTELQHHCSLMQQILQSRLTVLKQLMMQQSELDEACFQHALTEQLLLLQQEFATGPEPVQETHISQLIQEQVARLKPWLAKKQLELHLFEQSESLRARVMVSAGSLSILIHSMVQMAARAPGVTELTLRVALNTRQSEPTLQLSITDNGDGISQRIRQLITDNDTRSLQWHESDIGLLIVTKKQLAASLTIQSLEGLGCTLNFTLPLRVLALNDNKVLFQHLCIVDAIPASLTEHAQNLAGLAGNLLKCSDLAEFQRKTNTYNCDAAVIALPAPADMVQWRSAINALQTNCAVHCYAQPAHLAMWQQALPFSVQQAPFCLADLSESQLNEQRLPQLLVVDDNATNLAYMQVLLKEQKIQLHTASCGLDALSFCQQQRFDVVLLDIQLPDIAGTDVAKQLRQLAEYQQTPILAFTAHALEQERQAFMAAGMNDVILKPLDASKLAQILHWCSVAKAYTVGE